MKCFYGCALFDYSNKNIYWENRAPTDDEVEISNYLMNKSYNRKLSILHIGIGSSFIAKKFQNIHYIDGISVSKNEILNANFLNINHYRTYLINKHQNNFFESISSNFKKKYDLIIDVNLKSYSCCQLSFERVFNDYSKLLNMNGMILSGVNGMNWSCTLKPVWRFSIKKFFYRKLKEFVGPKSNILTIEECIKIAKSNNLVFDNKNKNIIIFTKP